jgi:ABC-type branched-subunit amino acid transport system ATPase component
MAFGFSAALGALAGTLSYANRRRLEIARALSSDGKLLFIDEPTAGMNPAESLQLAQTIQAIIIEGWPSW